METGKASIKKRNIKGLTKANKTKPLKEFVKMRNTEELQHLMDKAKEKSGKEGDTAVLKHTLIEYVSS